MSTLPTQYTSSSGITYTVTYTKDEVFGTSFYNKDVVPIKITYTENGIPYTVTITYTENQDGMWSATFTETYTSTGTLIFSETLTFQEISETLTFQEIEGQLSSYYYYYILN